MPAAAATRESVARLVGRGHDHVDFAILLQETAADAGLVLHCSSFSKCLAPGYRIGWTAAGRYTAQLQRLKLGSSHSVTACMA